MPEIPQIVVTAIAMFAGSSVASTMGFGLAVTAGPLLLLVLEPQTVVVVVNCCTLAVFLMVLAQTRGHLPLRQMAPTTVAGLVGVPFGVMLLEAVDAGMLRIGLAVLILGMTALVAFNVRMPQLRTAVVGPPIGVALGAMVGATGIGGLLLALLLLGTGWTRQALRASVAFFLLPVVVVAVVGYGFAGLLTAERASLVLVATGPLLLGFSFGGYAVRRMNDRMFRKGVLAVIAFASLLVLAQELIMAYGP